MIMMGMINFMEIRLSMFMIEFIVIRLGLMIYY